MSGMETGRTSHGTTIGVARGDRDVFWDLVEKVEAFLPTQSCDETDATHELRMAAYDARQRLEPRQ